MEEPASPHGAAPSNGETNSIPQGDGEGPAAAVAVAGVSRSKKCYSRAHTLANAASRFSNDFPTTNLIFAIGSSVQENKWHHFDLRHSNDSAAWKQSMMAFIKQKFAERDRDPKAKIVIPEVIYDQSIHEVALDLAVKKGIFSQMQYESYQNLLAQLKKDKGMRIVPHALFLITAVAIFSLYVFIIAVPVLR
jgi:hypothetical protein